MSAEPFPYDGLLPKEETTAIHFIKKYPEFDGRGSIVAILDTGVDPGAAGLQMTSDGKKKLIDIIDCNGSGDVIFSKSPTKVNRLDNGKWEIVSKTPSGRSLSFDSKWNCPSGEFYVGMKKAFEFYPKPLVSRLKNERSKKKQVEDAKLLESCQSALLEWSAKNPDLSKADRSSLEDKANLIAAKDALKDILKDYEDIGPIFDIVAFHDGTTWRAAMDVSGNGDFSNALAMADYAKNFEFGTVGEEDKLNYSFKFYGFDCPEEQKTLSIVTNSGSHGTHVAGIVGAFFPESPELNGVAPGAQIVSLKIGETRLGSMETGAALSRAFIEIVRLKCDLVNISYGEAPNIPDYGHFVDQLKELALKHNVTVVSSAGNGGPALSTVGCPGGTSSYMIGVGAFVTPAMIKAEYALLESSGSMPYTWSSQAPAYDGHIGVHIFAPGAAITSVPNWTLQPNQLMNGTSMSSPNACGCLSLLVSALKAKKLDFTPFRIKRAIMNTAKPIKQDRFGRGLLQVEKAMEYLEAHGSQIDNDVFFQVSVSGGDRGIYIRDLKTCQKDQVVYNVTVEPKFQEIVKNEIKVNFESHLSLIPSESWIKAPSFVQLNNGGRAFAVQIEPSKLSSGLHVGFIHAFDSKNFERGPLFEIPVTIAKPEKMDSLVYRQSDMKFCAGQMSRFFIDIPSNASYAEVKIVAQELEAPGRYVFHSNQIIPGKRYARTEVQSYFTVDENQDSFEKIITVEGGIPLEICVCPFWSSRGKSRFSLTVTVDGVSCAPGILNIFSNNGYLQFPTASSSSCAFKPAIALSKLIKFVRHDDKEPIMIKPLLPDRDHLPNGQRILQLILSYPFSVGATTSATPSFAPYSNHLYDIPVESFLYQVFDKNKKVVSFGDVYGSSVSLSAGDYVVKVEIRHESLSLLEKLTSSVVMGLEFPLSKEISVPIYKDLRSLLDGSDKVSRAISAAKDEVLRFYVPTTGLLSADDETKLINDFKADSGDTLQGFLSYTFGSKKVGAATSEKASFVPVVYHLSGLRKANPAKEFPNPSANDAKDPSRVLFEAVRDARIQNLTPEKVFDEESEAWKWHKDYYSKDIVYMNAMLRQLDSFNILDNLILRDPSKVIDLSKAHLIERIVKNIRQEIDEKSLAEYFGTNNTIKWSKENALEKADLGLQKDILIESSLRYLKLVYLKGDKTVWSEEISKIKKWTDLSSNEEAFSIQILEHIQKNHFGAIIKDLLEKKKKKQEVIKAESLRLSEKQLNTLVSYFLEKLGWTHISSWFCTKLIIDYPACYAGF